MKGHYCNCITKAQNVDTNDDIAKPRVIPRQLTLELTNQHTELTLNKIYSISYSEKLWW